jgi:hypothetical protein
MPPASDPLLTSIGDRLAAVEERLAVLETTIQPAQPDKHAKALGMTMIVVLLLFITAAGLIGLVALWKLVA